MFDKIMVGLFSFAAGAGGVYLLANNDFIDGRLSACKDMVSVMNNGIPLGLECSREGGEIYISTPKVPDVKFTHVVRHQAPTL